MLILDCELSAGDVVTVRLDIIITRVSFRESERSHLNVVAPLLNEGLIST